MPIFSILTDKLLSSHIILLSSGPIKFTVRETVMVNAISRGRKMADSAFSPAADIAIDTIE